jgi:hypothetical protein
MIEQMSSIIWCSKISSRPLRKFEFEIRQKSFKILRSSQSFTPTWQAKKVFGAANFRSAIRQNSHKTKRRADCAEINKTLDDN